MGVVKFDRTHLTAQIRLCDYKRLTKATLSKLIQRTHFAMSVTSIGLIILHTAFARHLFVSLLKKMDR